MKARNISKHISWNEATRSHTAIKLGIKNEPSETEFKSMKAVANYCFEPLRNHFNVPIKIESFLRKHTPNSQHFRGEAIDIDDDFGGVTNSQMFYWLLSNVHFDQLIWEFGDDNNPGWIHISYKKGHNRFKVTIAFKENGYTNYKHFRTIQEFKSFLTKIY